MAVQHRYPLLLRKLDLRNVNINPGSNPPLSSRFGLFTSPESLFTCPESLFPSSRNLYSHRPGIGIHMPTNTHRFQSFSESCNVHHKIVVRRPPD